MSVSDHVKVEGVREETDSLGEVNVPAEKLWGANTQNPKNWRDK
jgi:fumarate hydratase class II